MQQFEINQYAKKQIGNYLEEHQITLKEAMDNEAHNAEIASILHAGLPKMVQKIYSLKKFQSFFWEKRQLLEGYIQGRLEEAIKPTQSKQKKK